MTVVVAGPPTRKPLRDTAAPAEAADPDPPLLPLLPPPAPPAAVETVEAPPLEAPPAAAPGAAPAAVADCPAAELPVAMFPLVAVLLVEEALPPLPPKSPPPPPPPLAAAAPAGASLLMASRAPLASRERLGKEEEEKVASAEATATEEAEAEAAAATTMTATAKTAKASDSEARARRRPLVCLARAILYQEGRAGERERERVMSSSRDGRPCDEKKRAKEGRLKNVKENGKKKKTFARQKKKVTLQVFRFSFKRPKPRRLIQVSLPPFCWRKQSLLLSAIKTTATTKL